MGLAWGTVLWWFIPFKHSVEVQYLMSESQKLVAIVVFHMIKDMNSVEKKKKIA